MIYKPAELLLENRASLCVLELPLQVMGHCHENKGSDENEGQEQLPGCFLTPEDCLEGCLENTESMGCEFNTTNKGCYIHKAQIQGVGESKVHICWLFIGKNY